MIEQQEETHQPADDVGRGEVQGVVMVEQGAKSFAVVADAVLQLVVASVDIGVKVVLETAWRGQAGPGLGGAVVVAGKAITLRPDVSVVQVGTDLWRTKTGVVGRQVIVDAADHRMAVVRVHHRTEHGQIRNGGLEGPYRLWWIGWVEHPTLALRRMQLVVLGLRAELGPALMRRPPGLAGGGVGQLGRRRIERAAVKQRRLIGQKFLPGNGWRARRYNCLAATGRQDQRRRGQRSTTLKKTAS